MKELVVITGDWHINSLVALCEDEVVLDNGAIYHASTAQKWIRSCWQDFWEKVDDRRKEVDRTTVILNGDLVDGVSNHKVQLITTNEAIQLDMARHFVEPIRKIADGFYVLRGTFFHTGLDAFWEEIIGKEFDSIKEEDTQANSFFHLCLIAALVKLDVEHKPNTSGLVPWTEDAAAARQAYWTRQGYSVNGFMPPDVVIRSHCHRYGIGYSGGVFCFFCPGWQLIPSYVYAKKGGAYTMPPIGGLILTCEDGQFTKDPGILYSGLRQSPWLNQ
jgi:hypothetical protein